MARRVQLPESKLRRKRRIMRTRLAIVLGVFALFMFGVVVGLSWLPYIRIQNIAVAGVTTLQEEAVRSFVQNEISGRALFIFPKNNILSYAKDPLREKLLSQFPELERTSIRAKNFQTIEVSVVERSPQSLWCNAEAEGAQCFLMDGNGFAYALERPSLGAPYMRYFGLASTTPGYTAPIQPRQFLSPEQFIPLAALVSAIDENQKENRITDVRVDQNFDVEAEFKDGFVLKFVLAEAGKDVYERFMLAFASTPFVGKSTANFEYLDLRFGDKLYFKERALGEAAE